MMLFVYVSGLYKCTCGYSPCLSSFCTARACAFVAFVTWAACCCSTTVAQITMCFAFDRRYVRRIHDRKCIFSLLHLEAPVTVQINPAFPVTYTHDFSIRDPDCSRQHRRVPQAVLAWHYSVQDTLIRVPFGGSSGTALQLPDARRQLRQNV